MCPPASSRLTVYFFVSTLFHTALVCVTQRNTKHLELIFKTTHKCGSEFVISRIFCNVLGSASRSSSYFRRYNKHLVVCHTLISRSVFFFMFILLLSVSVCCSCYLFWSCPKEKKKTWGENLFVSYFY